jgi:hypothetical protein
VLVGSAALRHDLNVEAYSLTMLRTSAFVWMGLVATGLVLITLRILLAKSNGWLIAANAIALTATLYVCSFVNWPYAIATYNVGHSFEIAHAGPSLDVKYLRQLGPQVIPALNDFITRLDGKPFRKRLQAEKAVDFLRSRHRHANYYAWRAWSFRRQRLSSYLASEPNVKIEDLKERTGP